MGNDSIFKMLEILDFRNERFPDFDGAKRFCEKFGRSNIARVTSNRGVVAAQKYPVRKKVVEKIELEKIRFERN